MRITFETAKLAKEKGFGWGTDGYYTEYKITQIDPEYPEGGGAFSMSKGEVEYTNMYFKNGDRLDCNKSWENFAAPTQSQLQKWLRENHHIHLMVDIGINGYYCLCKKTVLHVVRTSHWVNEQENPYKTYEEALEAGLLHALKLIEE